MKRFEAWFVQSNLAEAANALCFANAASHGSMNTRAQLEHFAFPLRHQLKVKRVQRWSVACIYEKL